MQSILESGGDAPSPSIREDTWNQIAPLLDGAMEKLGQKDHDALVLRFFENKNFAEVGAALGASEDAAKMRVNRALEKLHGFFTKHGISSTTAIIAGEISAHSIQAAPVALAKSVTAVAIAKGVAASGATLALVKGTMKLMMWIKLKLLVGVTRRNFMVAKCQLNLLPIGLSPARKTNGQKTKKYTTSVLRSWKFPMSNLTKPC